MSISQILAYSIGGFSVGSLIYAVIVFVVCAIVINVVNGIVGKILQKSNKIDKLIQKFVQTAVKILLWVLAIIIVADMLGISTASLVALMSVVTLALSLSVQNIMSNLFSGITLLITKPFAEGDFVDIAGKTGNVKSVGLFYTVLDTLDNIVVSIPNSDVTGSSINNYSTEPKRRVDIKVCAAYTASTEDVKKAIGKAIKRDSRIDKDPEPFVRLSGYNSSDIEYTVRVWCNGAEYWDVYFDLLENIRDEFAAGGVSMAYPHVDVNVIKECP